MAGPPAGHSLNTPVLKGRADFDRNRFLSTVEKFGLNCTWQQASVCPCLNNDQTSQPSLDCKTCKGLGVEFYNSVPIRALFARQEANPEVGEQRGVIWDGTMQITTRPEITIGYGDRITILDAVMWYTEAVERKRTEAVSARYPIAQRHMTYIDDSSGLVTRVPEDVDRLTVHENGVVRELTKDTDYTVSGGKIDFSRGDLLGTAPRVGEKFGIRYFFNPIYVVSSLAPHPVSNVWSETKVPEPVMLTLPTTVTATLDYLISGSGDV